MAAASDEEPGGDSDNQAAELPLLDAFDEDTGKSLDAFCAAGSRPEAYKKPSKELAGLARLAAKALYAFTANSAPELPAAEASLPELYVDGFDAEQIWGQLETATGPALKRLKKQLKNLSPDIRLLDTNTEEALEELLEGFVGEEDEEPEVEDAEHADREDAEHAMADSGENAGIDIDVEDWNEFERKSKRRKAATTVPNLGMEPQAGELLPAEDTFLRLADMERFVQDAEEAAMKANQDEEHQSTDGESDEDEDLEGLDNDGLDNDGLGGEEESNSEEEDAELARLLESASEMAGKPAPRTRKQQRVQGDDNEKDADGVMYEDFFGSGGQAGGQQHDDGSEGAEEVSEGERDEHLADYELDDDADEDTEDGSQDQNAEEQDVRRQDAIGVKPHEDKDGSLAAESKLSAHERRLDRMAERARQLEEDNLGQKEWFMRGEAAAGSRPLNSALEIDLDFDRALQPPPQPTDETTASLEDLIKRRIVDRRFDDPERRAPPPDDLQKELAELDDKRSAKGLGEVYEEDYVRAKTGNALEDKDEKVRAEARLLLKGLFAKLDALSHFHFAPKPIIQDMTVRSEVPALAMEEVGPQVISEAARQLPEEVYAPPKSRAAKDTEDLSHTDRKRNRAAKKRAFKKRKEQQDAEKRVKGVLPDERSNIIGRKSADQDTAAAAAEKKARKKNKRKADDDAPRIKYTKSAAVFGHIQDAKDAKRPRDSTAPAVRASDFKL